MENKSKEDVLNGVQQSYQNINYNFFDMYITMDRGRKRKTQEDSSVILVHPHNEEIKSIILADGMGGLEYGARASNLGVKELIGWFESIPGQLFRDEELISSQLNKELYIIDSKIRKYCGNGGTTMSIAIVCEKNTIVTNIGDSRIYIVKNDNSFEQIGIDHSLTWNLYEDGKIVRKDDIRFHKQNNLITSRLGGKSPMLTIDTNIVYNNDYSSIFLFSDGVTDCLSEEQLIFKINTSTHEQITKNIVDLANKTTSYNNFLDDEYYDVIEGGKDNLTVSCLIKQKR